MKNNNNNDVVKIIKCFITVIKIAAKINQSKHIPPVKN